MGFSGDVEDYESEEGLERLPEADVFGPIAQLGSRVINPVVNKIVNGFCTEIEQQITDVEASDEGVVTERLQHMP